MSEKRVSFVDGAAWADADVAVTDVSVEAQDRTLSCCPSGLKGQPSPDLFRWSRYQKLSDIFFLFFFFLS